MPVPELSTSISNMNDENTIQSYTLLRIKRKRNDEPLAALVYDNPPSSPQDERKLKKARVGDDQDAKEGGIFRFAETLDERDWEASQSGVGAEKLRTRISNWLETTSSVPPGPTGTKRGLPLDDSVPSDRSITGPAAEPVQRVFRVLKRKKSTLPPQSEVKRGAPSSIPKADTTVTPVFKYYEAELVPGATPASFIPPSIQTGPAPPSFAARKRPRTKPLENAAPVRKDDEDMGQMSAFADMLQQYLKVNEDIVAESRPLKKPSRFPKHSNSAGTPSSLPLSRVPSAPKSAPDSPSTTSALQLQLHSESGQSGAANPVAKPDGATTGISVTAAPNEKINLKTVEILPFRDDIKMDDEYVYDLFILAPEGATHDQLLPMLNKGQVAALTGWASADDLIDDASDSGEEVDSEVDEDSNDEGNYRNDYPDADTDDDDLSEDDYGVRRVRYDGEREYSAGFWDDQEAREQRWDPPSDSDDEEYVERMML